VEWSGPKEVSGNDPKPKPKRVEKVWLKQNPINDEHFAVPLYKEITRGEPGTFLVMTGRYWLGEDSDADGHTAFKGKPCIIGENEGAKSKIELIKLWLMGRSF
jgi:hypothetical protein